MHAAMKAGFPLTSASAAKGEGARAPFRSALSTAISESLAPAARLVPKVVADLHVAAPLACACRYAVLRADHVSSRAEQGAHDVRRWLHLSELCTWLCGRSEGAMQCFFFVPHLASRLLLRRGREESTGTSKPNVVETNVVHIRGKYAL
jgi:hypothetical protein